MEKIIKMRAGTGRQAASEAASRQRGMLTEDEGGDAERQRGTRAIPAELRR